MEDNLELEVLEVLYHGTKFKYTANKILKEGFQEWSYFAVDLSTAIGQGGKYVFEVVFLKNDLPEYWQVRCENSIPPNRILRLSKYKKVRVFANTNTQNRVYDHALECCVTRPYCFKESKKSQKIIQQLIS